MLLTAGDANFVLTAISTVGFPIVCCGALLWMNWKQSQEHKEESQKFADALNKNTLALEKLSVLMDERMEKHD